MNILTAIKEVISKLFTGKTAAEKLGVSMAVSQAMLDGIRLWNDLYENRAPWLSGNVQSLHLAYAVSHELARLVTLEMQSELTGGTRAEFLAPLYDKMIADAGESFVEKACALGGVMLKPYLTADKSIATSYVQADSFFPTAFDGSGNITGCLFVDRKTAGRHYYTRVEYHSYTKREYVITNRAYMSDSAEELGRQVSLSAVPEWEGLSEETAIVSPRPLFSYFRIPGANRLDRSSPLGVSVYSEAVDKMKDADEQYSRLLWEFEATEAAIYADSTAIDTKAADNDRLPKLNKRLFKGVDLADLFKEYAPEIREHNYINGLDEILRKVEFLCGLAYGTLSRPNETDKTATEIKASRQRSYATVSAIQKSLQKALTDYIDVLCVLCDLYGIGGSGSVEASFSFDDSLVTDAETEQRVMLAEVGAGLLKPEIYLMKRYGVTEEQAKEMLPAAFGDDE